MQKRVKGGLAAVAMLAATIGPALANSAPSANQDYYGMPFGHGARVFNLTANDTDPEGDHLTITAVGGGATIVSDSQISYTPSSPGTGSFSYTITDGNGNFSQGTVIVAAYYCYPGIAC